MLLLCSCILIIIKWVLISVTWIVDRNTLWGLAFIVLAFSIFFLGPLILNLFKDFFIVKIEIKGIELLYLSYLYAVFNTILIYSQNVKSIFSGRSSTCWLSLQCHFKLILQQVSCPNIFVFKSFCLLCLNWLFVKVNHVFDIVLYLKLEFLLHKLAFHHQFEISQILYQLLNSEVFLEALLAIRVKFKQLACFRVLSPAITETVKNK